MGVKALELYQGGDWLTYRWPVAQAFDTLDRIQDLCLSCLWEGDVSVGALPDSGKLPSGGVAPGRAHAETFRAPAAGTEDVFETDEQEGPPFYLGVKDVIAGVADLCDDLAAELPAAEAELLPLHFGAMSQRWAAFEMRLHLESIRQKLAVATAAQDPHYLFDRIVKQAAQIKELLKQLDP